MAVSVLSFTVMGLTSIEHEGPYIFPHGPCASAACGLDSHCCWAQLYVFMALKYHHGCDPLDPQYSFTCLWPGVVFDSPSLLAFDTEAKEEEEAPCSILR